MIRFQVVYVRLAILLLSAGSVAFSASPDAVAARKYQNPAQEKLKRALRRGLPSLNQALPPLDAHVLSPINNDDVPKRSVSNGRTRIGVHRALGTSAMRNARRDGSVWRAAFRSAGATGLRLHFTNFAVG